MNKIEELKRQKRIHGLTEKISTKEMKKLNSGMPIQKIIGFINFDNMRINLNYNVLIPRYETEEVVNEALKYVNKKSKVLDLCCGSGFIGLTIKQKTGSNVTLSDVDNKAILQTKENAKINKLNVEIIKSNIFKNIDDKYDVIISNPPYIKTNSELPDSVLNFEPNHALFAGSDCNFFYKKILKNASKYLNKNGVIIFEISPNNSFFLKKQGFIIKKDINKKDRIAIKIF